VGGPKPKGDDISGQNPEIDFDPKLLSRALCSLRAEGAQGENDPMNQNRTVCVVFRDDAFGADSELANAVEAFEKTQKVQVVGRGPRFAAKVIGMDINEVAQVYVVQGQSGERVTPSSGSQASIDAMVDVLRGHGYTVRRTSQ
jgi:hypothetical protein